MALVGGSKVIFLDEPTSGVDVAARRDFWEVLREFKKDRVLILTTHFMEEADALGDRIAIMAEGELACCGGNMFLKRRFGVGYNLSMAIAESKIDKAEGKVSEETLAAITKLVQSHVPNAKVFQAVSTAVSFQLPQDDDALFPDMLDAIEAAKGELGIESYGCAVTTLEDVFLRVRTMGAEDAEERAASETDTERQRSSSIVQRQRSNSLMQAYDGIDNEKGVQMGQQFTALLTKRFLVAKRDRSGCICQMLLPVLMVLLAFTASSIAIIPTSFAKFDITTSVLPYSSDGVPFMLSLGAEGGGAAGAGSDFQPACSHGCECNKTCPYDALRKTFDLNCDLQDNLPSKCQCGGSLEGGGVYGSQAFNWEKDLNGAARDGANASVRSQLECTEFTGTRDLYTNFYAKFKQDYVEAYCRAAGEFPFNNQCVSSGDNNRDGGSGSGGGSGGSSPPRENCCAAFKTFVEDQVNAEFTAAAAPLNLAGLSCNPYKTVAEPGLVRTPNSHSYKYVTAGFPL
jgi:energy-coupling factor transporter ATP-binding protein EcfA2